ncbi:MAG: iron-containing alcohol dehydrogenase [Planctomycetota bacterium]
MIDYQLRTRLIAGERSIERLGELARELKGRRVLIVSDPGVVAAGIYQIGADQIRNAGLESVGFHDLAENPTTEHVRAGVQIAEEFRPDLLIGLGGGSSMEVFAKMMAVAVSSKSCVKSKWRVKNDLHSFVSGFRLGSHPKAVVGTVCRLKSRRSELGFEAYTP